MRSSNASDSKQNEKPQEILGTEDVGFSVLQADDAPKSNDAESKSEKVKIISPAPKVLSTSSLLSEDFLKEKEKKNNAEKEEGEENSNQKT